MSAPTCPSCGETLHPLQPAGAWPGWLICPYGHRWHLPLPLTFPGMSKPPNPAISDRVRVLIDTLYPRMAMKAAARRARVRQSSRSSTKTPFWTR